MDPGPARCAEPIHCLDDYLLMASPGSNECDTALCISLQLCAHLGVPIAAHQVDGPASQLTFLGIEIASSAGVVRL